MCSTVALSRAVHHALFYHTALSSSNYPAPDFSPTSVREAWRIDSTKTLVRSHPCCSLKKDAKMKGQAKYLLSLKGSEGDKGNIYS